MATVIPGSAGADILIGTKDDDVILGYDGDDILLGLGGNDVLNAGGGTDRLEGGTGDDIYERDSMAESGLDDWLVKPVSHRDLLRVVEQLAAPLASRRTA